MKTGIYYDMDFAEYKAADGINASALKQGVDSIAHMRLALAKTESKPSAPMQFGTLAHMLILQPEKFAQSVEVWEGGRKAGKAYAEFKQRNVGKYILSPSELADLFAAKDAVDANQHARTWLGSGKPEVCIFWDCPDTGVRCKAAIDWISDAMIMDVKTTRAKNHREFAREAGPYRYKYGLQFGWYQRGLYILTGERKPFYCLAVGNAAPWVVMPSHIPQDVIDDGEAKAMEVLQKYLDDDNDGDGYSDLVDLDLPSLCEMDLPELEGCEDDDK